MSDNEHDEDLYHDEIEIEDFEFDDEKQMYFYPCPCGDLFEISLTDLVSGEDVATCPSCSLLLKVIYDPQDFQSDENKEHRLATVKIPQKST